MSSLSSYSLTQTYQSTIWERFLFKIIKCGPIPQHIGIIMDGNRRFAKRQLSGCLITGYKLGCTVFVNAMHMCLELGINELTVFMFSQENSKRKLSEVESILNVVLSAYLQFEAEIDYINKIGVSFKGLGQWETLPLPEVSEVFARLVVKTKENTKLRINMALGYSGRDEILTSANTIIEAMGKGIISCEDVNEKLLLDIMALKGTTPVDLLIRTSGDTRLSDFLLWTTNDNTYLQFIKVTWPEFKLSHFLTAMLSFQKHTTAKFYNTQHKISDEEDQKSYISNFLLKQRKQQWENIFKLSAL